MPGRGNASCTKFWCEVPHYLFLDYCNVLYGAMCRYGNGVGVDVAKYTTPCCGW